MHRQKIAFGVGVLLSLLAAPSAANSRFPLASFLRVGSKNPSQIVVASTYGLVVSADAGKSWYWVCERTLYGRKIEKKEWRDAFLEMTASGAIVSGTDSLVRISKDQGCTLNTCQDLPVDPQFYDESKSNDQGLTSDIAADRASGDQQLVALVERHVPGSAGKFEKLQVYEAKEPEFAWKPLGSAFPEGLIRGITLEVAPSDPQRIYATAVDTRSKYHLLVSRDRAKTWTSIEIKEAEDTFGVYVAGIVPNDPDKIYARVDNQTEDGLADDSLLYSADAGQTWTRILQKHAKHLGFTLSEDGTTVLAGFGDPNDATRTVDLDVMGIYRAKVGEHQFEKIAEGSITCLRWTKAGLFACGSSSNADPFHIGRAKNADFKLGEQAFEPLLRLKDLKGPLPLSNHSDNECLSDWLGDGVTDGECARFQACPKPGEKFTPGAGPPLCGSSGQAGAAGQAGATGQAGGAGAAGQGNQLPPKNTSDCGGCTETASAGNTHFAAFIGILLAGLLGLRLRNRAVRGNY